MAERTGILTGRTGRRATVWYNDGSAWKGIPGIGSFSLAVGEASSDSYTAFEGSFSEVGEAPIGDATFSVDSYMPNHPAWKFLDKQWRAGEAVQVRVETVERTIFAAAAAAKVAIAKTSGEVTFSGTGSGKEAEDLTDAARGMAFKIGTALHTIVSISDADTPVFVCEGPAAAVPATTYSVVVPRLRWAFTGSIKQMAGAEVGQDSAVSSQLIITPTSQPALPTVEAAATT